MDETPAPDAATFWDDRYGGADRMWSGKVNHSLAAVAADLPVGSALDLGCGEGADALWLAAGGWQVTGVDVSATAVARAEAAAEAAGLTDRASFVVADLAGGAALAELGGSFDLVAASFLHSPIAFPRTEVLRAAAGQVAPGGHLVVVAHADVPPWASEADRRAHGGHGGPASRRFLTPEEEVAELDLAEEEWEVVVAETRSRPATAPDGTAAELDDAVVVLRRRSTTLSPCSPTSRP